MKRNDVTIRHTKTATGYDLVAIPKNYANTHYYALYRFTPRQNEFERGLKYRLWRVEYTYEGERIETPTGCAFSSIREASDWIKRDFYFI